MTTLNYKIAGTTAIRVLSADKKVGDEPTMSLCNINATACRVSVYYFKENYAVDGSGNAANTTETYYIIKSFDIPAYRTLTLDKTDMAFNNKGFDMYVELSAAQDDVDVIISI